MAFFERGIKVEEGDWAAEDTAITDWLEMHGRAAGPLYLNFPEESPLETVTILPRILTPRIVIEAIASADRSASQL